MRKVKTLTGRVIHKIMRAQARRQCKAAPSARRSDQGFVCAFIRGRWCGGWFETYWSAITLQSGKASACACRLLGLPPRFQALLLLFKVAHRDPAALACRDPV